MRIVWPVTILKDGKARGVSYLAALYFLLFGALGAEVPFLPNVMSLAGLSSGQVGMVIAAGTIVQIIVAPIFGRVADRRGPRLVLRVAAATASAALLLFVLPSNGVWTAMPLYVLFSAATAPLNPLTDAIALPACTQARIPYGRVRSIGSAGFFTGVLLSSTVAGRYGAATIIFTAAILFGAFAAMVSIPSADRPRTGQTRASPNEKAIRTLLLIPAFRRVLIVAAMVIGSHAMSDAFAVIYWRTSGIGAETIGAMLAIAVVSEFIVFMLVGPFLLERLGPALCAAIGAAAGGLRWAILAESPSLWPVLASQLLHGLTFSLVHLACMQSLASVAPRRFFATAQSLYSICSNAIASSIITLASGILFGTLQAHAFLLASLLCFAALPSAIRLKALAPEPRNDDYSALSV